ncbi:FeoB-associated Cys-rich membrane protein [Acetonema longum]|uniref:FeoB-associated Cys-rich membrane protein n=1 Tax=Acetonema longum TaxID=2374 RepID=UPI000907955F
MSTADVIVIGIIAGILSLAIYKIVKDKKRGVKCPGCGECGASSHKNSCKQ